LVLRIEWRITHGEKNPTKIRCWKKLTSGIEKQERQLDLWEFGSCEMRISVGARRSTVIIEDL
jgi:hypothetical protein